MGMPKPLSFHNLILFLAFYTSTSPPWGQVWGQGLLDESWVDSEYDHKREHSLNQPYWGHGWMIPNWDFMGSTVITDEQVRLTAATPSQEGSIWNSVPFEMRNWEIQLKFKIHGKEGDLAADGMALWYAKERMTPGTVFGSKDYFSGLVIAIDTYSNFDGSHIYPYISIMLNNGSLNYHHDGDGTVHEVGGCEVRVRNLEHDTWLMVRYENDVLTDLLGDYLWHECAKIEGLILPTGYYLGVSAATGDLMDHHDVISIHTREIVGGPPVQESDLKARAHLVPSAVQKSDPDDLAADEGDRHRNHRSGKWGWFKLIFVVVVVIVGVIGAVGGFYGYRQYQEYRHKKHRFY